MSTLRLLIHGVSIVLIILVESVLEQEYEFENAKGAVFIKRSLTPTEYLVNLAGKLVLLYMYTERMKAEVAAARYIQSNTSIPTPNVRCAFEDHGHYYIIADLIPGVTLAELPDDKKAPALKNLRDM